MKAKHFLWRLKWLTLTLLLIAIDIGPIPITGLLGLYVLLFKPIWFWQFINRLYSAD